MLLMKHRWLDNPYFQKARGMMTDCTTPAEMLGKDGCGAMEVELRDAFAAPDRTGAALVSFGAWKYNSGRKNLNLTNF